VSIRGGGCWAERMIGCERYSFRGAGKRRARQTHVRGCHRRKQNGHIFFVEHGGENDKGSPDQPGKQNKIRSNTCRVQARNEWDQQITEGLKGDWSTKVLKPFS